MASRFYTQEDMTCAHSALVEDGCPISGHSEWSDAEEIHQMSQQQRDNHKQQYSNSQTF